MKINLVYKNVFSNYIAVGWIALINLLALPFYYRLFSTEEWSVLAVYIATQSVFTILDAGLLQIMSKTVAQVDKDNEKPFFIYLVFSKYYSKVAFFSLLIVAITAPLVWSIYKSNYYLLFFLVIQVFFQLKNNCNVGFLVGIQNQTQANIRQCVFVTLRHVSFIACIFIFVKISIFYAFIFSMVTVIEYFFNKRLVKKLDRNRVLNTKIDYFSEIKKYKVKSMSMAIVAGSLVSQVDKLLLPNIVSAEEFGKYLLIANFALALFNLQYPILRAFIPHQMSSREEKNNDKKLFYAITVFCSVPCIFAIIFSEYICAKLLGTYDFSSKYLLCYRMIVCAVVINGYYNIFYSKMIRSNANRPIFFINIINSILVFFTVYIVAQYFGVIGGASGWLIASFMQLFISSSWTHFYNKNSEG